MITRIRRLDADLNRRIIAISDIHGNVGYLKGLLDKVHFSDNDMLIIIGDLIEKGPESLETVRFVMKLRQEYQHVYVSMGNIEYSRIGMFLDDSEAGNRNFVNYLRETEESWKVSLFFDMLREMSLDVKAVTESNVIGIKNQIKERYRREISFLEALPTMIEVGNYIFVHGGIPTDRLEELEGTEAYRYLKVRAFFQQDVRFEKCVAAGHWPVYLYSDTVDNMNPLLDREKHIAAIDGGCALKIGEQLNALLIPGPYADMDELSFEAYDTLPIITASKAQRQRERSVSIRYFNAEVVLLEDMGDLVRLKQKSSGDVFIAPKSYLYYGKEALFCNDYHDGLLEIREGDRLSVVEETSIGCIVKRDGMIGWYLNK